LEIKKGDRIMTLYKALKMYGADADEITIIFPASFRMESADYGFSGCTFATIAEEAPEAFTLTVSDISIKDDGADLKIWTRYGMAYRQNMAELLGDDGEDDYPDVWTAIRWLGWDLKKEDDFTIGEMKKLAEICNCDLVKVIEEIREEI